MKTGGDARSLTLSYSITMNYVKVMFIEILKLLVDVFLDLLSRRRQKYPEPRYTLTISQESKTNIRIFNRLFIIQKNRK
jgi:hypothetical protein